MSGGLAGTLNVQNEIAYIPTVEIREPEDPARRSAREEGIDELAASFRLVGMLQPMSVFRVQDGYEVVAGHRRLLAARRAPLAVVPAVIYAERPATLLEQRAAENLERRPFRFSEEAAMVRVLFDRVGQDVDKVCKALNRGRGWVDDRLLSELWPDSIKEAVDEGTLPIGAARELMRITVPEDRAFYTGHAISSGASVGLVRSWRQAWEMSRTCIDPANFGHPNSNGDFMPEPVNLPCWFCNEGVSVTEINHLRMCSRCSLAIAEHRP